jgi:hypothetical protein
MAERNHHEDIVEGMAEQLKDILAGSEQAMYLYLDDTHKMCNRKFAELLGYSSPEEWAKVKDPLAEGVAGKSQRAVVEAYQRAMDKSAASALKVTAKHRLGRTFEVDMIMVPVAYQGHKMALHFIQA